MNLIYPNDFEMGPKRRFELTNAFDFNEKKIKFKFSA